MAKSDYKPIEETIERYGFTPGEPVCLLMYRDGIGYWIAGYRIFDPYKLVNVTNPSKGGARTIHCDYSPDQLPIVVDRQQIFQRITMYKPHLVKRMIDVDCPYNFDDVFNNYGEIVSTHPKATTATCSARSAA